VRAIFYQDGRQQADQLASAFCERYAGNYPTTVACLKRDLNACLIFYDFPKAHWNTICTSNVTDRLFDEVNRRGRKLAAAFRNETSCRLMFYTIAASLKFRRIPMPIGEGP
jgi:putative transposase